MMKIVGAENWSRELLKIAEATEVPLKGRRAREEQAGRDGNE